MKALFFLGHPAHFHLLKHTILSFKAKKIRVIVVIKSKDVLEELLQSYGIQYINIYQHVKKSRNALSILFQSIIGLIIRDFKLARIVLKEKPSYLAGTDWSIIHVGFLFGIPSIVLNEDDTNATPENKYFYPLAKTLLIPSCCDKGMWGRKRVTYNSYHELAYLHPRQFTADIKIIKQFNPNLEPYVIIRLVNLSASHDIGKGGLNIDLIKEIIQYAKDSGVKIYITSEKPIASKIEDYRIIIHPKEIHHALYYANLFIGDSQTMAAEAAVLGTPYIRFNDFVGKIGYLNELEEKYCLGFGFKTNQSEEMLIKTKELIHMKNIKELFKGGHEKLLSEKINFAEFLNWFLETYPESYNTLKVNPDYQYIFK
jgi:predicted glycosyltransferase